MSDPIERLALRVQLPAFPGTTLAPGVADLLADGLGGICLFGSNTAGGLDSTALLTAAIREISASAVVATDEEGGDVTRLHARTGSPVLGPAEGGRREHLQRRPGGKDSGGRVADRWHRPALRGPERGSRGRGRAVRGRSSRPR